MAGSVTHALMVDTRILMEMKTARNVPTATQPQEEGGRMLISVESMVVVIISHDVLPLCCRPIAVPFGLRYVHT